MPSSPKEYISPWLGDALGHHISVLDRDTVLLPCQRVSLKPGTGRDDTSAGRSVPSRLLKPGTINACAIAGWRGMVTLLSTTRSP